MIKRNQRLLNAVNFSSDAMLLYISYIIAMNLRFFVMDGINAVASTSQNYLFNAFIYSLAITFLYYVAGLYESLRFKEIWHDSFKVIIINAFGVLCWFSILFIKKITDYSRLALILFFATSCVAIIAKRFVVRGILRFFRLRKFNLKHVVIVGDGPLAHQFIDDIEKHPELGICIDGYFGNEKADSYALLGAFEDMETVLDENNPDSIIVALEAHEIGYLDKTLSIADKEGIRVELIPLYNNYMPAHPTVENIGNCKLLNLRATPLDSFGWSLAKRTIDILGSLILIIISGPLMIVTAVGVKISSPGPIFFVQDRVGKNKKNFKMIKFRSMRTDIDHNGWTVNNDQRKTKFGSFIRKYSIDELPQLFNVLIGDMSLVGPRPEIPKYVREFKETVPLYLVRQQVRPGMTGWAQIHGLRGDTSIESRVEYDIWYIENWSLGLDIKILLDTVFKGKFCNDEVRI